jgi:hypothetical protein
VAQRKIDVFPRIYPAPYFARVHDLLPRPFAALISPAPILWDLDRRFRLMDRHEGYVQVLTLSTPPI